MEFLLVDSTGGAYESILALPSQYELSSANDATEKPTNPAVPSRNHAGIPFAPADCPSFVGNPEVLFNSRDWTM